MKYAHFVFILSALFIQAAHARSVTSFKKSDSLTAIAQFLYEVGPDLPSSVKLSDRKVSEIDFQRCVLVSTEVVLDDAEKSIRQVLRYFPDEEVPFEEALTDLEDYLDNQSFYQCFFHKTAKHFSVNSTYYVDASDRIHLRLDKITPAQE